MDYVKVINPGATYTTLAGSNQDEDFWGAHIANNVLPISGRTYRVVKELDHPIFSYNRIMTIMDSDYNAFIIGVSGVEESTADEFMSQSMATTIPQAPRPAQIQIKPVRRNPITHQENYKYAIGDVILVTDPGSTHFNKRFRVTDPSYRGYDVVTSRNETGTDRSIGFHYHQFVRYIPEPELLPEDKPKFSINELLEVLNQNKPADEVLLDLMDHITN